MKIERARPFLAIYCIIYDDNEQILMLKRQNTGYADGKWSFPAGHVDDGESLTTAASRELFEETGLSVDKNDWQFVTMIHRQSSDRRTIDVFMQATNWQGELINNEPDKCAQLKFIKEPLKLDLVDYIQPIFHQLTANRIITNDLMRYCEFGW